MSGYEIRKLVDEGTMAHVADASYGAIYPALDRLQADGLVTSHEERAPGKPPRRVYSLTPEGRAAFHDAIHRMPGEDVFRSPFLMVAACATEVDREHLVRVVDARIAWCRDEIRRLEQEHGSCGNDPRAAGWRWTMDYALEMFTTSLRWLEANRKRLEALARTPDDGTRPVAGVSSAATAVPGE